MMAVINFFTAVLIFLTIRYEIFYHVENDFAGDVYILRVKIF